MEIKKIGYDIETWTKDMICKGCKSELTLSCKDLKTSDRKKYYCMCKACNTYAEVDLTGCSLLLKQFVDRSGFTGSTSSAWD